LSVWTKVWNQIHHYREFQDCQIHHQSFQSHHQRVFKIARFNIRFGSRPVVNRDSVFKITIVDNSFITREFSRSPKFNNQTHRQTVFKITQFNNRFIAAECSRSPDSTTDAIIINHNFKTHQIFLSLSSSDSILKIQIEFWQQEQGVSNSSERED
jgi:hypothetical protein